MPQSTIGIPPAPEHLSPEAKEKWKDVTQKLDDMGILVYADSDVVAQYCETWEAWLKSVEIVREQGHTIHLERGPIRNPESRALIDLGANLIRLRAVLGMSPADRTRVRKEKKAEETKKPKLNLRVS